MTRRESETEEHRRLSSSTSSRDQELAWLPVLFTGDPKGRVNARNVATPTPGPSSFRSDRGSMTSTSG